MRLPVRRLAATLAAIGAAALAPFLAPGGGAAAAQDDPLLEEGRALYKQLCAHCHGIDMVNPGTSSYDLRRYPQDRRDEFLRVLHDGQGAMPAWGDILADDEMDALWRYVVRRGGAEPAPEEEAGGEAAPATVADGATPATVAEGALTVCLARNGGIMSAHRADGGVGVDYALSEAIAGAVGLPLAVTWYEAEQEEESSPVREAYAMLAHGLCDLVPGFALLEGAVEGVAGGRGALPRWEGRPAHLAEGFQVDLRPVAVTRPYMRAEMGLVVREGIDPGPVERLADLRGVALGLEQGTLAGAITARQASREALAEAVTLNPGPTFLWRMEAGAFDAALTTTGAYDFHVRQNPITALRLTPYRHPIGFNLAVAGLASNPALIEAADAAIAALGEPGLAALGRPAADEARPALPEPTPWPPRGPWAPCSRASVTSGRPGTDARGSGGRPRSAHPRSRRPPPCKPRPRPPAPTARGHTSSRDATGRAGASDRVRPAYSRRGRHGP